MPSVPPQFENTPFAGSIMHSATWNKELDLKDKRVAVIGTGASATQIIPSLAGGVQQLEVFQRSATWTVSRWQVKYPWIIRKIFLIWPQRWLVYW